MQIDTSTWRSSTKRLTGLLLTAGALFEIAPVHDFVIGLVAAHPHWAGAVATLTGLAALLHNPQVASVLGIDDPEQAAK